MKIVVFGEKSFVTGFRLAGVEAKEVSWEEDSTQYLDEEIESLLEKEDVGIIVIKKENLQNLSKRVREKVQRSADPVLVTLGGGGGRLREDIRRAIGIDLMEE